MTRCPCCGGAQFTQTPILWPELVEAWELSAEEAAYIDRQQGFACLTCGSNLRSMTLAAALLGSLGIEGTLREPLGSVDHLRVLEINQAGSLTPFLSAWPKHTLVRYPEVDMQAMPFADGSFDIVVHSDTLEHVADPLLGLSEVRRVLGSPGFTCFTVPIVVARLTRSRHGLPASYHGSDDGGQSLVHTEFGADVWTQVARAGFDECRLHCLEYPAGIAVVACRGVVLATSDAQLQRARADAGQLQSRDQEIADLRRELNEITRSRGWRSVLMIRRAARALRRSGR